MRWPWTRQVESVQKQLDAVNARLDDILNAVEKSSATGAILMLDQKLSELTKLNTLAFREFKADITNSEGTMSKTISDNLGPLNGQLKAMADAMVDMPERFPVLPSSGELAAVFRGAQDELINEVTTLRIRVAELEGAVKIADQRVSESDKASRALANWIHTTHRLDVKGLPGTIKQLFQAQSKSAK